MEYGLSHQSSWAVGRDGLSPRRMLPRLFGSSTLSSSTATKYLVGEIMIESLTAEPTAAMIEEALPDFGQVVSEYKRQVFFLALDLTGNHHDAEDLSQEAFLSAYRGFSRFRGQSSIWTWLYRITVNTHISRSRKKAVKLVRNATPLDDPNHPFQDPVDAGVEGNPEKQTLCSGIQQRLEQALDALSERERTVFVLRHFQNLKIREIAEVLERTEGTVKTTLFRAVRKLQEELSDYRLEKSQ